jgi:wyosine [tRNA(Phe)-imidazoG37] synthetase (radical SAM superfamily)
MMMGYVFGPVPSRRLGLSLGVDLIPPKTCTYDCLYCQLGRTITKTTEVGSFVPAGRVIGEIQERLTHTTPDAITLAGSGEPTLCKDVDWVIGSIHEFTDTPVALLTNGSLLWKDEIRARVLGADIIMPTLTSAMERTFQRIHRPCAGIHLAAVVDGFRRLRQEYTGEIYVELVLLAGINDTPAEVEGLVSLTRELLPDKIQINTVVRPPADPSALAVPKGRLEEIRRMLGNRAEIIVEAPKPAQTKPGDPLVGPCLEMIQRRPLRTIDIANAMNIPVEQVEGLVHGLVFKGYIRPRAHLGEIYYLRNEDDIVE